MKRNKEKGRKKIVSAVAVAGIVSLGIGPVWSQQTGQPGSSEYQSKAGQKAGAGAMISTSALMDSRVVDPKNREVGTLSNLFVDPETGRIMRADIEFSKGLFGDSKTYSVAWDQLSVKRQGNELVITLNQPVLDRIQQGREQSAGDGTQQRQDERQQSQRREQQQGGSGILGQDSSETGQISASQMSSEQIRKVQQSLNKEGFDAGQVNGQWNSQTQTAIRSFQQSKGLQPTGELNKQTLDELGLDADEFRQGEGGRGTSGMGQPSR